MIPVLDEYKNSDYARPNQAIDPAKKDKDYHLQNAKYIYNLFCRNKCAWGISGFDKFDVLRKYSRGEQDVEQYKSFITSDTSTTTSSTVALDSFDSTPLSRVAKREGWLNILWQNISPAPMIMEALHGQFDDLDFDLYVDVIDPESKDIEENEAYQKLFEGLNLDWQNEYKIKAGIPIDEQTYYPKSVQEFEVMKAQGGFKLGVARAMQKTLRYSFGLDPGSWDTVTRKKVVDDLLCTGYGAVRDYFDTEDSKFKQKWIDPARVVTQCSNETDYNDSDYHGYFPSEGINISQLRVIFPEVDEAEWLSLAKSAIGTYGNPMSWGARYSLLDPSTQTYGYDGFKVPIFEAEWTDVDVQKRKYFSDRYGRKQVKDLEFTDKEKSGVKNVSLRLKRKCTWIVGTKYSYDWGLVRMASRKNYSKPQSTFHIEQLLQPCLMERLCPMIDQLEIVFLKHQNSVAKMVENGYALNTSMLGNVALGGKKLDTPQVIRLLKQTGFLLYQYSPGTGFYTGGAANPITAFDGGMKNRITETVQQLDMWFGQIKTHTGIDVVALSSQPKEADTKEGMEERIQITQSIFKTILKATQEIKQSAGECLMRRIQTGVKNDTTIRNAYAGVISKADMETLVRMTSEGTQMGLKLKARPDRRAKLRFEHWVEIALQNTREQRPGINVNEAMKFGALMDAGVDMDELIQMFDYAVIKNGEQAIADRNQAMQIQGDQQRQTDAQKGQLELAKIKTEAEAKIAEESVRGQIKDRQMNKEIVRDVYSSLVEASNAEEGINTSIRR